MTNKTATVGKSDLIIDGARVVDGSGAAAYGADVAVDSGRIAEIGDLSRWTAGQRIDGRGQVLAPGFIDVHTHDDLEVLRRPGMACKVSQGVTTVVAGNCGISAAPVAPTGALPAPFPLLGGPDAFVYPRVSDYRGAFERARPAVNLALLVGHSALRVGAMSGSLERAASDEEIARMAAALEGALTEGALGLSSGLDYPPALAAAAGELIRLARVLKGHPGAIYTTHMRDEGDRVVEAVEETLQTAREAGVPVVISHHKCAGRVNYGRSRQTLALIRNAQQHQSVALDVYPYTASSTSLLPRFVHKAEKVLVTYSDPHPEFNNRPLHEIAEHWGCSLDDAAERLYPAGAIYFQMDEGDLRRILAFPSTMVGSDGLPAMRNPHPRLWGTFPRVLGRYVRDLRLLALEEAVHKMTGLSAGTFGLTGRGLVRRGYCADLVLFDPARVEDTATFDDPEQPARGIDTVLVNGEIAWSSRDDRGGRAGQFLTLEG